MKWSLPVSLLALALASPASAQVTNQTTGVGGYATIGAAISAASWGDVLVLDPGVYPEAVVVDRDITIEGGGAATIQSETGNGVIDVEGGWTLTLRGVTLTSGARRGVNAQGNNELLLEDVVFDGTTTTTTGGGIQALNPLGVTLTDVTFVGTTASSNGGALYLDSPAAPVVLTDVTFDQTSTGSRGGAIYADSVDLTCTRCVFDATSAVLFGGAVYADNGGTVTFTDSEFHSSFGNNGGGIYADTGVLALNVVRTLFCGTSATSNGGAIESAAPVTMTNTRIVETSAVAGGGLYLRGGASSLLNNTIMGVGGDAVVVTGSGVSAEVVNNHIEDSSGFALLFTVATAPNIAHNAFFNNSGTVFGESLNAGNLTTDNPDPVAWSQDGNCANDQLWPAPDSPMIDAGSTSLLDTDGSVSDIGYAGGPDADPTFHADGDGDGDIFLFDCDDTEPAVYPGATEVCDTLDNDCDGVTDTDAVDVDRWYLDCDGDGQGDATTEVLQCFEPAPAGCPWLSFAALGDDAWLDCDDVNASVYWGADELCLAGDQNCDGDDDLNAVDAETYYTDDDGDGYGAIGQPFCVVSPPAGFSELDGDCDDGDDTWYPGAPDVCGDGLDTDCNGGDGGPADVIEWYPDLDGDTYGDPDATPTLDCGDLSGSGYTDLAGATDCDDALDTVNPAATEVCNLVDDDCDGNIDDVGPVVTWYEDADDDGFGAASVEDDCQPGPEWVPVGGDCDDQDDLVHPDAVESCNGVDDDCDSLVDAEDPQATGVVPGWPDWDGDGYGACPDGAPPCDGEPVCADQLGDGWSDVNTDCDDGSDRINPGADEVLGNDVDENCDGVQDGGRGSEPPPDESGCNCSQGGPSPAVGWGLAALLALRRRRR